MKRNFAIVIAALTLCIPRSATAQSLSEDTFLNFEAICLAQIDEPSKFVQRATAMGAVELPANLAAVLLADHPGRAFRIKSKAQPLYLSISDPGPSCTITSRDGDGPATEAIFAKFIKHNALEPEDVGSERFDYFAVTYNANPNHPGHAVVVIHYSKLIPGVQIAMLPEDAISTLGISAPVWP
jgi:hypothetical protein